jgi:hypothetical protein
VYLAHTEVTDAGLKELAALKGPMRLSLVGCKAVTDAGAAELKTALPRCNVIH